MAETREEEVAGAACAGRDARGAHRSGGAVTMRDLLVIVPTRGRPGNVRRVLEAWDATDAWADADLMLAVDGDDPEIRGYEEIGAERAHAGQVSLWGEPHWRPMVDKLNAAAWAATDLYADRPFALGFAGDDHLPRTKGWARAYLDALRELGTGIVYGNDLILGERLPTQWAMTSDIVAKLGRMVPADVEHLWCDNAIGALGHVAGCSRYLPDVVVEHCHPHGGTAPMDAGYERVNSPEQHNADEQRFRRWVLTRLGADAAKVRRLRGELGPRVIVACAGTDRKWGNHLGVPRHLAPMDGEPLLHRTVRQALAFSGDVHVTTSTDDERYDVPGAKRHVITGEHMNEYASSRALWSQDDRTILLYGDVYYTDAAMDLIGGYTGESWRMFGRAGPSQLTGSPWGEVFAGSWLPRHHAMLAEHLDKVALAYAAGVCRRTTPWELLRSIQCTPLDRHVVDPRWFAEIDDETDDIDTPDEYDRHPAASAVEVAAHG